MVLDPEVLAICVYQVRHLRQSHGATASGGKAIDQTPDPLNRVRISVRTIDKDGSQISCSFQVPHLNPALSYKDVDGLIRGKFDAYWNDKAPKCSDVAIIYDRVSASGSAKK